MIRINLLPVKELNAEVSRRREIILGGFCLGLTVAVIAAVYVVQFGRTAAMEREVEGLRTELVALSAKAKGVGDLERKVAEYKGKHQVIEDIKKKKAGPVKIMHSLASSTPSKLWLTQFRETGGSLTITGVAADNQTIAAFLKALGNHVYFKDTELVETTQIEQAGMPPRRFLIKSQLLYQPELKQANAARPITTAQVAKKN